MVSMYECVYVYEQETMRENEPMKSRDILLLFCNTFCPVDRELQGRSSLSYKPRRKVTHVS